MAKVTSNRQIINYYVKLRLTIGMAACLSFTSHLLTIHNLTSFYNSGIDGKLAVNLNHIFINRIVYKNQINWRSIINGCLINRNIL